MTTWFRRMVTKLSQAKCCGPVGEAAAEDAIGGVADGFAAGGVEVGRRGCFFVSDVADGGGVVGGPCVVHGDGGVEEVAGVGWGVRDVEADGGEGLFVPFASGGGCGGSG